MAMRAAGSTLRRRFAWTFVSAAAIVSVSLVWIGVYSATKKQVLGPDAKGAGQRRQGRRHRSNIPSFGGRSSPIGNRAGGISGRAARRSKASGQLPLAAVRLLREVGRDAVGALGESVGSGARGGMGRAAERLWPIFGDSAGAGGAGSAAGSDRSGAIGASGDRVSQRSIGGFSAFAARRRHGAQLSIEPRGSRRRERVSPVGVAARRVRIFSGRVVRSRRGQERGKERSEDRHGGTRRLAVADLVR